MDNFAYNNVEIYSNVKSPIKLNFTNRIIIYGNNTTSTC